jgi:hypothetical protein
MDATETQYRLVRRGGVKEYLDAYGAVTTDAAEAALFPSATSATLFLLTHVDQPTPWMWEPCFPHQAVA